MFKKLLIVLAGLVVIFLVIVAVQPNDFRVSRSATLGASPAALFSQVNDHHKYGKQNFMAKAVSLFMDCDKMVGPQFEKGLASLGEVAAASSTKP